METIEGTVRRVIFRSPQGYTVLELVPSGKAVSMTAVGHLAAVQEAEELKITGEWMQHPRFGKQFKVAHYFSKLPSDAAGLTRYLSSGIVPGIGPAFAERIVAHFGDALFTIAESAPQRLTEVSGIGAKRAASLAKTLVEQKHVRDVMVFLQGIDVGPSIALRICKAWGVQANEILRTDPYRLVQDIDGVGFVTADAIASRIGVEKNSPSRIRAGLLHLTQLARESGDTVSEKTSLVERAAEFLGVDLLDVETAMRELIAERILIERLVQGEIVVGRSWLVKTEEAIAQSLSRMLNERLHVSIDEQTLHIVDRHIALTDEQRTAVQSALTHSITVITGGPGTGKTTVLRALVMLLSRRSEPFILCAPTGRAAKRMSEATGMPASTVHRLLGFGRGGGGLLRWNSNRRRLSSMKCRWWMCRLWRRF